MCMPPLVLLLVLVIRHDEPSHIDVCCSLHDVPCHLIHAYCKAAHNAWSMHPYVC